MVTKADFNVEEWQQILVAPQIASLLVMLASPSGPAGAVAEMFASSKLIAKTIKKTSGNALIDALVADYKEKIEKREQVESPIKSKDPQEIKELGLQFMRDLELLLAQKAPAEADGFKKWVYEAAELSSEAAKEGGFLGIGGVRVSEAENAALGEIARALNILI